MEQFGDGRPDLVPRRGLIDTADGRTGVVAVQNGGVNPQALVEKGQRAARGREGYRGKNLVVGNQPDNLELTAQPGNPLASADGRSRE